MSGRKSRTKGRGYEYELRDHFRAMGWQANRVPLSGASQGYKDDIDVTDPNGTKFFIEAKRRKNDYKTIYALYDTFKDNNVLAINYEPETKLMFWISDTFTDIYNPQGFIYSKSYQDFKQHKHAVRKILGLAKLAKTTPWLAIRDDNKDTLFIRVI